MAKRTWIILAGAFLIVGTVGVGANTIAQYLGWTVTSLDPEELSSQLRPHDLIWKPDGAGPFPTVILFSGCSGPKDNMRVWADMLTNRGWAAVVVDSHTPRELNTFQKWRLVCAGQLFTGAERAGDVLVSLDDVRRMPFVDQERIVSLGMSHGGWSIMDLLAMSPPAELPYNLAAMPQASSTNPFEGVIGLVFLYPWCGPTNRATGVGWDLDASVMFVLAADDMIAPAQDCLELVEVLRVRQRVETVMIEDVTHGFDQRERALFSTLEFDAEATKVAIEAVGGFLDEIAAESLK